MPEKDGTGPQLRGNFKKNGYKVTLGREAILDVLDKADEHLSAEDIYLSVHATYPAIGLTTVYRTLELLDKMGLVYKFDFGDGRARYELAEGGRGENHHHHLVCTQCNRVIDYKDFMEVELKMLRETEKGLATKYHFKITNHMIQFYGICEKCSKGK
jgi:Fur family ferric uptake transcriptional regulator